MWWIFHVIVLTVLGYPLVNSQGPLEDRCKLYPALIKPGSSVMKVDIDQSCVAGEVEWNYPMADLYVHSYRTDRPYRLCLEVTWSSFVGSMKDLTGGLNKTIPLPTENHPSCAVQAIDGTNIIVIQPTPNRRYQVNFFYRIVYLH